MVEGVFQENKGQVRARDPSLLDTPANSGKLFRVQESDPDHRLPKLNYHTMKEKQIRELLSQVELSTTGDKNTLMARHQQYGFIYFVCESLLTRYSPAGRCCIMPTRTDRPTNGKIWNNLGRN